MSIVSGTGVVFSVVIGLWIGQSWATAPVESRLLTQTPVQTSMQTQVQTQQIHKTLLEVFQKIDLLQREIQDLRGEMERQDQVLAELKAAQAPVIAAPVIAVPVSQSPVPQPPVSESSEPIYRSEPAVSTAPPSGMESESAPLDSKIIN